MRAIRKLCQSISCLNIVSVLRHGKIKGMSCFFIDMELCEGNLYDLMKGGPSSMGVQFIWGIMVQIVNGLMFIHGQGEVHRDLKPQNSSFQMHSRVLLIVSPLPSNIERKTLENRGFWVDK